MENLKEIISSIDSEKPNLNPTKIYNEGWMTRLLFKASVDENLKYNDLEFGKIKNWTSEALISSPFIKAPNAREGYTRADLAFGDFNVDYEKRGEIILSNEAEIFGIIEAKMGSNLSKGTKYYATDYNQASRNMACIAKQTLQNDISKIYFIVVVPENLLDRYEIEKQIDKNLMVNQIQNRFDIYEDDFKKDQNMDILISKCESCIVQAWSYENWIERIKNSNSKNSLKEFYEKCKKWNRLK